jgi:hypothetical protein
MITIRKSRALKQKLKIMDNPNTFADSLSVFGKTIASSYLNEDITIIIPIRLE